MYLGSQKWIYDMLNIIFVLSLNAK